MPMGEFPGNFESTNLSRNNLSREIFLTTFCFFEVIVGELVVKSPYEASEDHQQAAEDAEVRGAAQRETAQWQAP